MAAKKFLWGSKNLLQFINGLVDKRTYLRMPNQWVRWKKKNGMLRRVRSYCSHNQEDGMERSWTECFAQELGNHAAGLMYQSPIATAKMVDQGSCPRVDEGSRWAWAAE